LPKWAGAPSVKITANGAIAATYTTTIANSAPNSIATGPAGNYWFVEFNSENVVKITLRGTMAACPLAGIDNPPNTRPRPRLRLLQATQSKS
jgi:hypothetical protein